MVWILLCGNNIPIKLIFKTSIYMECDALAKRWGTKYFGVIKGRHKR